MNPAEVATGLAIEKALSESPAFRRIDDRLYVVKQGSTFVLLTIVRGGENGALLRCVAQLLKGARMDGELALKLLELNSHMRFGAFAYDADNDLILFCHSILGGATLDPEEVTAVVRDVALVSDEYDNKIAERYGGQTMRDLLEEAAMERILASDPTAFPFDREGD